MEGGKDFAQQLSPLLFQKELCFSSLNLPSQNMGVWLAKNVVMVGWRMWLTIPTAQCCNFGVYVLTCCNILYEFRFWFDCHLLLAVYSWDMIAIF